MKNRISLVAASCAVLTLATAAVHAVNPVLVDKAGGGDFTTVQDAISSFCIGGANAGETAPFVINVKASTGPYEEIMTLSDTVPGSGDLAGDLVIQSDTPGTYALIQLKHGLGGGGDGILIGQDADVDITIRDIHFMPAAAGVPQGGMTDDFILIDESTPNAFANTYAFYHCMFTDIKADGSPAITSRSEAFNDPTTTFSTGAGGDVMLKCLGDDGEQMNLIVDDCVFYGNWGATGSETGSGYQTMRVGLMGADTDSVTIHNSVFAFSRDNAIHITDFGIAVAASYNITGDDVTAGTDNCTVIYKPQQETDGIGIFLEGTAALNAQYNIDGVIIEGIPSLDADPPGNGISKIYTNGTTQEINGEGILNVSNCIINVYGAGIQTAPSSAETFTNVTINAQGTAPAVDVVGVFSGSSADLTFTDCIFSGADTVFVDNANAVVGGSAYNGTINVDFSAYVEAGPDAIGTRGTIQTDGVNIVTADPQFASKDATSASYFDVSNSAYAGAGTGGADLRGGADYLEVLQGRNWSLYR